MLGQQLWILTPFVNSIMHICLVISSSASIVWFMAIRKVIKLSVVIYLANEKRRICQVSGKDPHQK